MSIPFSVAASVRVGTFQTSLMTNPGGFTKIHWEFNIPITADYENVSNSIITQLLINGDPSSATWLGGRFVNKWGTVDPAVAIEYDIGQIAAGATFQIKMIVANSMTVGIKNGLVS
jgi:hypothetical protein